MLHAVRRGKGPPSSFGRHRMTINLTKTQIDAVLPKVAKGLQQYVWLQAMRDVSDL